MYVDHFSGSGRSELICRLTCPSVRLDANNIEVVTEATRWPTGLGIARRASVNSFGYGGANAHAILESLESKTATEAIIRDDTRLHEQPNGHNGHITNGRELRDAPDRSQLIVVPVSAASAKSLQERVRQTKQAIQTALETNQDPAALDQLVHALCERKTHFTAARHTLHFRLTTHNASKRTLQFIDSDLDSTDLKTPPSSGPSPGPLPFAFIFTGQGAQYPAMARELLLAGCDTSSAFLSTIRSLDAILQALPSQQAPSWTLEETILDTDPATSQVHHVTRSQPLCTAIQMALVQMLNAWGVHPSRVVGHSSGEIAAAYAAGLLTDEQAILVAYYRGLAVGSMRDEGGGAMLAAGVDAETAQDLIRDCGLGDIVTVGCVNSPESVTFSGSAEGIKGLLAKLHDLGKFARELRTGGRAYHSFMMKEVGALYEELLEPLFFSEQPPNGISDHTHSSCSRRQHEEQSPVLMISSSSRIASVSPLSPQTTATVDRPTAASAKYWRHNLEQPVQFFSALSDMLVSQGVSTKLSLLEIGPHPALKGPIEQTRAWILKQDPNAVLPMTPYSHTLKRDHDSELSMKNLASSLFIHQHCHLQWRYVNNNLWGQPAPSGSHHLPPYPWDYSSGILWHEPRPSVETRQKKHPCHELLGSLQLAGNGIDWTWRKVLVLDEDSWLRHHKVESQIVFPAAGYLAMIIEAFCQRVDHIQQQMQMPTALEFQDVNISAALVVPDDERMQKRTELHTSLSPRRLTTSALSARWCDFSISSWVAGDDDNTASTSALHCVGRVRATTPDGSNIHTNNLLLSHTNGFTEWSSMTSWYDKFAQQGLCYGPEFQAITEFRSPTTLNQTRREVICRTRSNIPENQKPGVQYYPVHPITLDTCLQSAIVSASAGDRNSVRAYLPEFIDRCVVRLPPATGQTDTGAAVIHSRVTMTGVSTGRMDCSLFGNFKSDGQDTTPTVQFQRVKMSEYTAKVTASTTDEQVLDDELDGASSSSTLPRQPCLRVQWKPDISRCFQSPLSSLGSGMAATCTPNQAVASYIASFVDGCKPQQSLQDGCSSRVVQDEDDLGFFFRASAGAVLDLAGHKNPRMRVLEVVAPADDEGERHNLKTARDWWQSGILGRESGFRRYSSWQVRTIKRSRVSGDGEGEDMQLELELMGQPALDGIANRGAKDQDDDASAGPFDLVVFSMSSCALEQLFGQGDISTAVAARFVAGLVDPRGMVLLRTSSSNTSARPGDGVNALFGQGGLGVVRVSVSMPCGEQFVVAGRNEHHDDVGKTTIAPAVRLDGKMDNGVHAVILVSYLVARHGHLS